MLLRVVQQLCIPRTQYHAYQKSDARQLTVATGCTKGQQVYGTQLHPMAMHVSVNGATHVQAQGG